MEQLNSNAAAQAAAKEQVNYEVIEQQLLEANKKIEELKSELAWSSRAYE